MIKLWPWEKNHGLHCCMVYNFSATKVLHTSRFLLNLFVNANKWLTGYMNDVFHSSISWISAVPLYKLQANLSLLIIIFVCWFSDKLSLFWQIKPLSVRYGLGISDHDSEGRLVTAEFDSFYLLNGYVPNSGDGLKRLVFDLKRYITLSCFLFWTNDCPSDSSHTGLQNGTCLWAITWK